MRSAKSILHGCNQLRATCATCAMCASYAATTSSVPPIAITLPRSSHNALLQDARMAWLECRAVAPCPAWAGRCRPSRAAASICPRRWRRSGPAGRRPRAKLTSSSARTMTTPALSSAMRLRRPARSTRFFNDCPETSKIGRSRPTWRLAAATANRRGVYPDRNHLGTVLPSRMAGVSKRTQPGTAPKTPSASGLANASVFLTGRPLTTSRTAISLILPERVRGMSGTCRICAGT